MGGPAPPSLHGRRSVSGGPPTGRVAFACQSSSPPRPTPLAAGGPNRPSTRCSTAAFGGVKPGPPQLVKVVHEPDAVRVPLVLAPAVLRQPLHEVGADAPGPRLLGDDVGNLFLRDFHPDQVFELPHTVSLGCGPPPLPAGGAPPGAGRNSPLRSFTY